MGIGVSGWALARAVASTGQLGVVSGTALAHVLVRRFEAERSDEGLLRAISLFPFPEVAERVRKRFLRPRRGRRSRFAPVPMYTLRSRTDLTELTVLANFVEISLAKEGHDGPVGLNLLEKVQLPNLPSLYGAMLAGVDYVLMGAGMPRAIPAVLDRLALHQPVSLTVPVSGDEDAVIAFDPAALARSERPLRRPYFLPIVSSDVLATMLARKSSGSIDGFVVEGPLAGGHNAPPRGGAPQGAASEPVYGERDVPNLERIRQLGVPFWLAGSYASAERLAEARRRGAHGVQVGTAFALCRESGLRSDLKLALLRASARGEVTVRTDPRASPTGMPFKVAALASTLSQEAIYAERSRRCDVGYLRRAFRTADGAIGYRCSAEREADFRAKGGQPTDSEHRLCLCNGLLATIGLGQRRASGYEEPPLVTAGEDVKTIARFSGWTVAPYGAAEVISSLLRGLEGTAGGSPDSAGSALGEPA